MTRWTPIPLAVLWLAGVASVPLHAQEARPLFDGESLAGWEVTELSGRGLVEVREGAIVLSRGDPMTGITWAESFPRIGYEVTLEAMRVEGNDFFSAITFPVGEDPCTLVVGGWGGSLVGLSSLEGADASENETGRSMRLEDERWYRIRLRVTDEKIQAWIDERMVVDLYHVDRHLSIRVEVWASQPFGIASWRTTAALRNIQLLELPGGTRPESCPSGECRTGAWPAAGQASSVHRAVGWQTTSTSTGRNR